MRRIRMVRTQIRVQRLIKQICKIVICVTVSIARFGYFFKGTSNNAVLCGVIFGLRGSAAISRRSGSV